MPSMYEEMSSNQMKSYLLIALFSAFVILLGYFVGYTMDFGYGITVIAIILSVLMSVGSYYFSDKIVLKLSGAKLVTREENPHIYHLVGGLCIAAGIPEPKVYIINDSSPNAFATGRDPQHAAVALTTGLLEKMNRQELEGVVAHELSHIANYDTRLSMLIAVLVGIVAMIANIAMRSMRYNTSNNKKGTPALMIIGIIFIILSPIIAQLIRFAVSRSREYLADASAAKLTRYPVGLANALRKLDADRTPLLAANNATAHLYIVNPLKNIGGFMSNMFSTHPPIAERVKKLEAM